jgi:Tfp pilus assembly protein PilV
MMTNSQAVARGFSLIEAMIAVVVLSFGLLALAVLQSSLFRAGAEAKARSNAMSIAQGALEAARSFAFTQPPTASYTADTGFTTYTALATEPLDTTVSGGITYTGCRQVVRYVYDPASGQFVAANTVDYSATASGGTITVECSESVTNATVFDPARPEFKQVSIAVAWSGDAGEVKTIQITDTVSSVSPSDSVMVLKSPTAGIPGPSIHITPPSGTGVVPIAIGTNESGEDIAAASSNPKPEQFVDDMSAVTNFTVQTFTGNRDSDSVLLNRQQQVSVASCICSKTGETSSASNLAYGPTIWNGKQLAYTEPQAIIGKPVAAAIISSSDSEITTVCTTCCRDHHDAPKAKQPVSFDPYRPDALRNGAGGDHLHYGYRKSGSTYNLDTRLLAGAETNNEYVEACRLVRVNGRFRVTVDSWMNYLSVIPMNKGVPPTGFQNPSFVDVYSNFVSDYITEVMGARPSNYPATPLPSPSPALRVTNTTYYNTIERPGDGTGTDGTIKIDEAISDADRRQLVDFGLYVDYLSKDTIEAYTCAINNDNTGDCEGYGNRNPLEFIPFYAVNVANLGYWRSEFPNVATVSNVRYSNQGAQVGDGGIVSGEADKYSSPFKVLEAIRRGNTGLTNTAATDDDDAAQGVEDAQLFVKQGGIGNVSLHHVYVNLVLSSAAQLKLDVARVDTAVTDACRPYGDGNSWDCAYDGSATSAITLRFRNFSKQNADRQLCLAANANIAATTYLDGTKDEYMDVRLSNLANQNWTLQIQVKDAGTGTCAAGLGYTSP